VVYLVHTHALSLSDKPRSAVYHALWQQSTGNWSSEFRIRFLRVSIKLPKFPY